MNSLEKLQTNIEMIEGHIRTCHAMMRAMEERGNIQAAKAWAKKGLLNKPLLTDAKLRMFIFKEDHTNTLIQTSQES